MRTCKGLCGLICRLKKITILLILMLLCTSIYAQKFQQRIEWNADKNAYEYKFEVRQGDSIIKSLVTTDNYVELNLPSGSYEYRVSVYDFLGRIQDRSAWQTLEIAKAAQPSFSNVEKTAEIDPDKGDTVVLPVELENVAPGTAVTLVNTKTGAEIPGTLIMKKDSDGISETGQAEAEFSKIKDGEYKLVVENPSGLKSESPAITVKTKDKVAEYEAMAKAAKEAREQAEQEAREAAERKREEEKVRLIAEKEEEERREQEAREQAEEEERKKEEEKARVLAEKKAKRQKIRGFEVKVGSGLEYSLFQDDILSRKTSDPIFKSEGFEKMNLAPYAAISFVPNPHWIINPGLELSAHAFVFDYKAPGSEDFASEYSQRFAVASLQLNIVGQFRLHPDKFFVNLKAGGGVTDIYFKTTYSEGRDPSIRNYLYPKINAGLSIEFIPFRHLVMEAGTDYNKILSSKVNVSYLLPYVVLGVRF